MASVRILFVLVTAMCWMFEVQSQPDPAICTPHSPEGKGLPLPVLPEQFRLRIEANILGWNHTVEVVEYYDNVNNRGTVLNIMGGKISQTVINYSTEEIITVHSDGRCNVRNLTAGGFNIFGFKLQNGTAHIGSISDIFRFGASYNESYVGTTYVRGIPVNHWRSCLYNEERNGTSTLDYYFTIPGYNTSYGDTQVPLRLTLNGTAANAKFVDGKIVNLPGTHSFSHVYEFFDVEFHPVFADRTFEPTLGTVCPGRKSLKPLPTIPYRFHQNLEIVIPDKKLAFYISETYNYKAKIISYHYKFGMNNSQPATPYRSLDDFNTGLTYRINMSSGFCNITPIAVSSYDAFSPDNIHVQIKSMASFFDFGDQDWQYQGLTQLRDMETESWIAERNNWKPEWMFKTQSQVNSTWEFFFTATGWNTQSGLNKSSNMPVMAKIRWTTMTDEGKVKNGSYIINYFHFDTYVDMSHFDLTPCFNSVDREDMAFELLDTGIYNQYIANNTVEFYHGASYSIAMAAGVTPTRVAHVFASGDKNGVTTVFFTILGIPDVKGDAVNMTKQLPLKDAAANLEAKMNGVDSQFVVNFNQNGKEISLKVKQDSLRNMFNPSLPSDEDGSQQFSIGAFVGFGLAMLVVGGILAMGVVTFINKRKTQEVPYNVQS